MSFFDAFWLISIGLFCSERRIPKVPKFPSKCTCSAKQMSNFARAEHRKRAKRAMLWHFCSLTFFFSDTDVVWHARCFSLRFVSLATRRNLNSFGLTPRCMRSKVLLPCEMKFSTLKRSKFVLFKSYSLVCLMPFYCDSKRLYLYF